MIVVTRTLSSHSSVPTIRVGGVHTAVVSRAGLAEVMVQDCLEARAAGATWTPKLVFSSNGQGLALAARDPSFAAALSAADIVHADGMSVVFASRLSGTRLPERVATTDFIFDACAAAEQSGLSFYFLGGREEDSARAVGAFQARFPNLQVVGRRDGYYSEAEEAEILADIRAARPDVLWLALGRPRQEYTALKFQKALPGVGWIKTCGGMLDYYSGRSSRAPSWMQRAGLEWLYRSLREPIRLGSRYATTNVLAAWLLLTRTG